MVLGSGFGRHLRHGTAKRSDVTRMRGVADPGHRRPPPSPAEIIALRGNFELVPLKRNDRDYMEASLGRDQRVDG
jgi:hypothetical protein